MLSVCFTKAAFKVWRVVLGLRLRLRLAGCDSDDDMVNCSATARGGEKIYLPSHTAQQKCLEPKWLRSCRRYCCCAVVAVVALALGGGHQDPPGAPTRESAAECIGINNIFWSNQDNRRELQ